MWIQLVKNAAQDFYTSRCYLLSADTAFAEFMCEREKVMSLWDHFPAISMQLDYIITR